MLSSILSGERKGDIMKKLLLTATLLLSATSIYAAAEPTVIGSGGERFSVTPVAGDGNCAFTAIGKSRTEVVAALKDAVEDNYAAYKEFNNSRRAMHDLVKALSFGSSVDMINSVLSQVESFIVENAAQYSSNPEDRTPATLAFEELVSFRSELGSFSAGSFDVSKRFLQSRIENMYYARYEAFQEALRKELQESGMPQSRLSSKAELKQSIEDVFARNNGRASWLPMGLISGVHERLGLNLAVWSSRDQTPGRVSLYQFSAPGDNVMDPSVRHVVWNGSHFDILTVQQ